MQSVNDGVVRLHGKAGERDVQFSISADSTRDSSPADEALPIHRLAAKAQIKQLEDGVKGSLCCVRRVVSTRAFFYHAECWGIFAPALLCSPPAFW